MMRKLQIRLKFRLPFEEKKNISIILQVFQRKLGYHLFELYN